VIRDRHPRTLASSDPIAAEADLLQYTLGEGPCLQSAEDDADYLLFDVHTETRWPRFAQALQEQTPVRAVLAFRLIGPSEAALNVFAGRPGAFSDDALTTGSIFAAHVSSLVALNAAEDETANLEVALRGSREIGVAIGVLMAHHRLTQEAAFDRLRSASQHLQQKLREVASVVVETGDLPQHAVAANQAAPATVGSRPIAAAEPA
jgi:hypothetical protein